MFVLGKYWLRGGPTLSGEICIALGLVLSSFFYLNIRLSIRQTLEIGIREVTLGKLRKMAQKKLVERIDLTDKECGSIKSEVSQVVL